MLKKDCGILVMNYVVRKMASEGKETPVGTLIILRRQKKSVCKEMLCICTAENGVDYMNEKFSENSGHKSGKISLT